MLTCDVQFSRLSSLTRSLDALGSMQLVVAIAKSPSLLLGRAVDHLIRASRIPTGGNVQEEVMSGNLRLYDIVETMELELRERCGARFFNASVYLPDRLRFWQRQEEYLETLQWNVCNPEIGGVQMIVASVEEKQKVMARFMAVQDECGLLQFHSPDRMQSVLNITRIGSSFQPTYKQIFEFGGIMHAGKPILVINADIALQHRAGYHLLRPKDMWGVLVGFSRQTFSHGNDPVECCSTKHYDGNGRMGMIYMDSHEVRIIIWIRGRLSVR